MPKQGIGNGGSNAGELSSFRDLFEKDRSHGIQICVKDATETNAKCKMG